MLKSLASKIFIAMILLLLIAIGATTIVTFDQFKENAKNQHLNNLENKEKTVLEALDYIISSYPETVTTENLYHVLDKEMLALANINDATINIFTPMGDVLTSSRPKENILLLKEIKPLIIQRLSKKNHKLIYKHQKNKNEKASTISSLSYIYNINLEPIAVLHIPYTHTDESWQKQFTKLLSKYSLLLTVIVLSGGIMAWFFSKKITSEIDLVSEHIKNIQLVKSNKPIAYDSDDELKPLVDAYNSMVFKFNEQSKQLARVEREDAWRLMAKQVAHEIKNPLTPMQLTVQNFQRKFDPKDEKITEKVDDLCNSLLTQIQTISVIANNFSEFSKISPKKTDVIAAHEVIKNTLDIFDGKSITYATDNPNTQLNLSKDYLVRIITNLVKNALQAIPRGTQPNIQVRLSSSQTKTTITVKDNGTGIKQEIAYKIFEPNFTTKNSGTGLGLAMVKKIIEDYDGRIYFNNNLSIGSTFTIEFPKVKTETI